MYIVSYSNPPFFSPFAAGLAIHVSQDIVSNVFIDLVFLGDEDGKSSGSNAKVQQELLIESHHKKRKHSAMAGSFLEQSMQDSAEVEKPTMTPVPVRIAALEALEVVLTVVYFLTIITMTL